MLHQDRNAPLWARTGANSPVHTQGKEVTRAAGGISLMSFFYIKIYKNKNKNSHSKFKR